MKKVTTKRLVEDTVSYISPADVLAYLKRNGAISAFLKNAINCDPEIIFKGLNMSKVSPQGVIGAFFMWDVVPEGRAYWDTLHHAWIHYLDVNHVVGWEK